MSLTRRLALFLLIATGVSFPAAAQSPSLPRAVGDSPVGRWVAEQPSAGGIGSWWDFRADGQVTMYVGAIATSKVTHTADTVTLPSGTVNGPPLVLNYKIAGETLTLGKAGEPDVTFTRVGPAPTPSDPLLGRWRPNPPATPSENQTIAAYQKAMANGLYVFAADNTQSVRIPFTSRTGTWNPQSHTLQIQGMPHSYTFRRDGAKLVLSQPPDGQKADGQKPDVEKTDTYIPDPLYP
jgi:hypothetical protein